MFKFYNTRTKTLEVPHTVKLDDDGNVVSFTGTDGTHTPQDTVLYRILDLYDQNGTPLYEGDTVRFKGKVYTIPEISKISPLRGKTVAGVYHLHKTLM